MGSGDAGKRAAPAARVLVVEDEASIRAAVEQALVDGGFVVGGRAHGLDLEQVLAGFRPDLVILDIMLPGRDGFRLLDVVREQTDAAVILLTARDGVDDRLRGLDSGADDYDPNIVEVHVSGLRRKLESRGPRIVHTVRGLGYKLGPPESGQSS